MDRSLITHCHVIFAGRNWWVFDDGYEYNIITTRQRDYYRVPSTTKRIYQCLLGMQSIPPSFRANIALSKQLIIGASYPEYGYGPIYRYGRYRYNWFSMLIVFHRVVYGLQSM